MRHEITELDVFSLGKVVAVVYAAAGMLSWAFLPVFLLIPFGDEGAVAKGFMLLFLLAAPLMNAIFGFLFGVIAAVAYNLLAGAIGGLRLTLRQEP